MMQRVIYSTLSLPLRRRIRFTNQHEALFQHCRLKNNVKFISTTNKNNLSDSSSSQEEKILVSNIEGRTKEEITTTTQPPLPKKKILKRVIPSRHSRKIQPLIASADIVDDMTQELVSSPIGSWYTYDSDFKADGDDYNDNQGFIVSDVWSQKVEFVLRGHSSLIDGSIIRHELMHESLELPSLIDGDNVSERVSAMNSLLERMENEAEAYKEAYIVAHSAIEEVTEQSSSSKQKQQSKEQQEQQSSSEIFKGAPPGPTISMYDLILDAYAITSQSNAIKQAMSLFNKATHRHIQNGGHDNIQRDTIPTALTFNAVIRAASNTPFDYQSNCTDEKVRDEALNAAFWVFDKMHHTDCTHRNTATYIYMLRTLKKVMPESRVRGNIAHALFDLAVEEKVMDDSIYEELKINGGGELYDNWLKHMEGKGDMPIDEEWTRNCVKRRYLVDSNIY